MSNATQGETDVAIVGAGPAGLTAAHYLRKAGVSSVEVLERERQAGGIPRHSDHPGYGLRDLHRVVGGPAYARSLTDRALESGAVIRTSTTVVGWDGDMQLRVVSEAGTQRLAARVVVLATGARERSRASRLIAGDRPDGVFTTGQLQNTVHLHHQSVGTRAVIVGAELVSWSAAMTLRSTGCSVVLMTSTHHHVESYAAFAIPGRLLLGIPVARRTQVMRIIGRNRVEAVEVRNIDTGARRCVECDVVVFTGDWVPDNELARLRGLAIDPGHRGPTVDTALRTSVSGVFAAGNVAHPVDTADVAALDGRHVADQVMRYLEGEPPPAPGIRVIARDPFQWISPNIVRLGDPDPARSRVLLWPREFHRSPRIVVQQDGRVIATRRSPWPMSPGRVFRLPFGVLEGLDPTGGDVVVGLA